MYVYSKTIQNILLFIQGGFQKDNPASIGRLRALINTLRKVMTVLAIGYLQYKYTKNKTLTKNKNAKTKDLSEKSFFKMHIDSIKPWFIINTSMKTLLYTKRQMFSGSVPRVPRYLAVWSKRHRRGEAASLHRGQKRPCGRSRRMSALCAGSFPFLFSERKQR